MGKEAPSDEYQVVRAVRSLAYNRGLQPLVEGRIERAEAKIRSHLMTNNLYSKRIGVYEVMMGEEGDIRLSRLPVDDNWKQLSLPRVVDSKRPMDH